MLPRSVLALVLVASLGGCNAILGLGDFKDAESAGSGASSSGGPTTGTGGTGAATGGGGSGGTAGGGGVGGGGAGAYKCDVGQTFDIFTAADLDNGQLDAESLALVAGTNGRVHVAVFNTTSKQLYARSVKSMPVSTAIAKYPDMPGMLSQDGRIVNGYVTSSGVVFFGRFDNDLGEVTVSGTPDIVPNPTPVLAVYPAPASCTHFDSAVAQFSGGVTRFAATCDDGTIRWLYGGDASKPTAEFQLNGNLTDDSYNVLDYGYASGRHFMLVGKNDLEAGAKTYVRTGPLPADLSNAQEVVIEPGLVTLPFGIVPRPSDDGLVMFTGQFDPVTFMNDPQAHLRFGVVPAADFASFASSPNTYLVHQAAYTKALDLVVWNRPIVSGNVLVAAGAAKFDVILPNEVHLFMWADDGTPLVFSEFVVAAESGNTITAAGAAPLQVATLVAWIERIESSLIYSVRGRLVSCTKSG